VRRELEGKNSFQLYPHHFSGFRKIQSQKRLADQSGELRYFGEVRKEEEMVLYILLSLAFVGLIVWRVRVARKNSEYWGFHTKGIGLKDYIRWFFGL